MTQEQLQDLLLDPIFQFNFKVQKCNPFLFDPIRFSFQNQYGTRDYYTFKSRNTEQDTITNENFYKTIGTWNEGTFTIPNHERGFTTYSQDVITEMTAETDWISQDESDFLRELYKSPDIKIIYRDQIIPVVITSTTWDEKTIARQKLSRHIISFRLSIKPTTI